MNKYIIGIDEVGRGSLFYDMVICCTVTSKSKEKIDELLKTIKVTDSKRITKKRREEIEVEILKIIDNHFFFNCTAEEIDRLNINKAQEECLKRLIKIIDNHYKIENIDKIYLDGINDFGLKNIIGKNNCKCIVKGDLTEPIISSASILAKNYRDRTIINMKDSTIDKYDIRSNKGYGTKKHIEAIKKYGLHPLHRKSFTKKILK